MSRGAADRVLVEDRSQRRFAWARHFELTLTCAVLDTDGQSGGGRVQRSRLRRCIWFPFEIVGGQRFRDILNSAAAVLPVSVLDAGPRRGVLRQGGVAAATAGQLSRAELAERRLRAAGREAQYSLVPVPIRVLSLVPGRRQRHPGHAADTFGDVDARLFRSNAC